jgi:hypothetical protein
MSTDASRRELRYQDPRAKSADASASEPILIRRTQRANFTRSLGCHLSRSEDGRAALTSEHLGRCCAGARQDSPATPLTLRFDVLERGRMWELRPHHAAR